jgi:DNA-binding CsgD family transcriptional regulator
MRVTAGEDRGAIIRVIEDETAAFWNKDYDAWARCWVHAPYVRRWGWWAARGGVTVRDGWEQQADRMRQLMAANPLPNPSATAVRREDLNLRVGRDMAWVTFDQYAPATGDAMDVPGLSQEVRILEKHDGEWKIVCLYFLQRSLDHLGSAMVRVDGRSVVAWMNPAAEQELLENQSIAVRVGRLRAVDRGADQRLQAAIRWAAHLDEGLYPGRGALPIVLDGGDGQPANVCWVIAESSMVLVAINDRQRIEDRLAAAALVYGITPAQLRLAGLIVAGHDLVSAAGRLGVSVNTTRTHLQRMFEKTGVRSQPALVRALLSVASPLS